MRRILLLLALLLPGMLWSDLPSVRILFVGDSITDGGWGRSGGSMQPAEERNLKDQNHLYGHSYMFLCAARLESQSPERGYHCQNRGISGYTLEDLHARWEQDVATFRPHLLSILIGTNDVAKHYDRSREPFDVAGWEQRYRAYIERTQSALPQAKLILGTPFVAAVGRLGAKADFQQRAAAIDACAEVVRRLAAEYEAVLVDYHRCFARMAEQYPTIEASYWIWDGIHPTPAGHARMADCWLAAVGPTLTN